MAIAIKVEGLSKAYQLGQIGTGTISRDLERFVAKVRGKEDPFLKIGETNDRTIVSKSNVVWSLKDIDFEIQQGDAVGIIGRNGAGKSTLLKLLSRVTSPTTGKIKAKGRIASLLEVGTGFHPELSGRENIYLNGAILGMRKKEIAKKFDEIVDFSGVDKYIDTPVKRYSSGMYVRLAFAVAAHLESEILIVDEVLAVGDSEFQKKCLGKMGDISKNEGRTVLFVSHNMTATQNLCSKVILLKNGVINYNGLTEQGIKLYLNVEKKTTSVDSERIFIENQKDDFFRLNKIRIWQTNIEGFNFLTSEEINIFFDYNILKNISGLRIGFDLIDLTTDAIVFRSFSDDNEREMANSVPGKYSSCSRIPKNFLKEGSYGIKILVGIHNVRWIISNELLYEFDINNLNGLNLSYADIRPGVIMPDLTWINTIIN
jgi:lipopolysaccharide transport system ATP-binding protein